MENSINNGCGSWNHILLSPGVFPRQRPDVREICAGKHFHAPENAPFHSENPPQVSRFYKTDKIYLATPEIFLIIENTHPSGRALITIDHDSEVL
jgi:hypothetical protein